MAPSRSDNKCCVNCCWSVTVSDSTPDHVEDVSAADSDPETDLELESSLADEELEGARSLVTSELTLAFGEANAVAARRGGRLVLLVGEVKAGKTTLLVEMWNHFLVRGPLGSAKLAGSRTALAFEERAYLSRIESGRSEADTQRTAEEDDGLLHLRVHAHQRELVDLFLADVTGEHFERIREGVGVLDELPCALVSIDS